MPSDQQAPASAGAIPEKTMRVLMVGDIVGEEAAEWFASRVAQLRSEFDLDWVVANAENCSVTGPSPMNGFGITTSVLNVLLDSGIDVITGGNHSWDGPDVAEVLTHPRVARPANLAHDLGQGIVTVDGPAGRLTVVNLLCPTASLPGMHAPQPQPLWESWATIREALPEPGSVVIDLHGESPWEKASMAAALDGEVSAVAGTHTHDASLRGHVLPGGTGYISELGMTGRLGHTGGGFDPIHFAHRFRGEDYAGLPPFQLAAGELTLGGAVLEIRSGRCHSITRIS